MTCALSVLYHHIFIFNTTAGDWSISIPVTMRAISFHLIFFPIMSHSWYFEHCWQSLWGKDLFQILLVVGLLVKNLTQLVKNPAVHCEIHRNPHSVISWPNLMQSIPYIVFKICFNIICSPMPEWSMNFSLSVCATGLIYLSHGFGYPNGWHMKLLVTSSLLATNILLSILFSKSLSLCSFLKVTGHTKQKVKL